MSMIEAISRLRAILEGLGFICTNLNVANEKAQRKFTRKPEQHEWLTAVIWTTVNANGPLPGKGMPVQTILFGNQLEDRFVWVLSGTRRFRKKRERFAKRLRKRAELIVKLSESVEYCLEHPGPVTLSVNSNDTLCWTCIQSGCPHCSAIDSELSHEVKLNTPPGFWQSKRC